MSFKVGLAAFYDRSGPRQIEVQKESPRKTVEAIVPAPLLTRGSGGFKGFWRIEEAFVPKR